MTALLSSAFSTIHNVHDFFHSTGFAIATDVVVFLAVVFWLALAFWVFKDARRRIGDGLVVGVATLLGLVPYLGPVVYLLFRPSETIADVRSRHAELRALEQQLARARPTCPVCSSAVEPDYLACPVCATRLRQPCGTCDAPLEPLWQICPYCASSLEPAQPDLDAALTGEARALAVVENGDGDLLQREPRVADV